MWKRTCAFLRSIDTIAAMTAARTEQTRPVAESGALRHLAPARGRITIPPGARSSPVAHWRTAPPVPGSLERKPVMAVLVGFDDSPYGRDALELGLNIAARRHEPATVVTAYPDDERGLMIAINDSSWLREVRATAERKLDAAKRIVGNRAEVTYEAIGPASASRALHEYAERTRPAALVVGSSERAALGRFSLGSTVERLLPGAPCPVAVAPRGYSGSHQPLRSIAVAYDESQEAQHALELATTIARRDGLTMRIVAVSGSADAALQGRLEKIAAALGEGLRVTGESIVGSNVVDILADLPGEHPDLLVCGSRGYGPVRQVLLGSVSARLIRDATYPVIVVPRTA